MNIKRNISYFFAIFIFLSLLSGCSKELEIKNIENLSFIEEFNNQKEVLHVSTAEREANFTLWTYQLYSENSVDEYIELINNCGYDGIDLCVLWGDFEYEPGKYNWEFVDSIIDKIVQKGYTISLNLVFWTYNLEWKNLLDYQETYDGTIYAFDDVRKEFPCLNSESNLTYIKASLEAFSSHFANKYGEKITRWGIRTSCHGKLEYSAVADLDYSKNSMDAFYSYLISKYKNIDDFNSYYGFEIDSWENLFEIQKTTLTLKCAYDWKMFKQKTIINLFNESARIFRAAKADIPIAFQVGSFSNTMSAVFRSMFDPYLVASATNADIIHVDGTLDQPYNFVLDLIETTTKKAVAIELDGVWQGEDVLDKYAAQVVTLGESGVNYLNFANWSKEDISKYHDSYFRRYAFSYKNTGTRKEAVSDEIILINTLDFVLKEPPSDLYELYKNAYKVMSGSSSRKVTFLTDTQVMANPALLDGITAVHMGAIDTVTYMYEELGLILAKHKCSLIDDKNGQPNFLNEYEQPLPEEVQVKLRSKLKNS